MIVAAASTGSPALFWAGAVIGGGGFGVAFLGGLRALSAVVPPHHRAQVMSAFYIVAYSAISLPAILAGVLVTPLGLDADLRALRQRDRRARPGRRLRGLAHAPAPVASRLAIEIA